MRASKILWSMASRLCKSGRPKMLVTQEQYIHSQHVYLLAPQAYGRFSTYFATPSFFEAQGKLLVDPSDNTKLALSQREEHRKLGKLMLSLGDPTIKETSAIYSYMHNNPSLFHESEDNVYFAHYRRDRQETHLLRFDRMKQETFINHIKREDTGSRPDISYLLEAETWNLRWPTSEGYTLHFKARDVHAQLDRYRTPAYKEDTRTRADRWLDPLLESFKDQRSALWELKTEFNALDDWVRESENAGVTFSTTPPAVTPK